MPDLLLELFSEEIPARMQKQAAEDLRRLVTHALVESGLTYEGAAAFATPRRLALTVHGLTARSADVTEEKKGPRVGAPDKAIEGFLRGAGLASIDQAKIQPDKKGDFYVATISKPGRAAEEIVAEAVPAVIRDFPWPKSMRWGRRSAPAGSPFAGNDAEGSASLRWVRPLRSILCTFGPETEEPVVIPFEVGGVDAGDATYGHRFLANGEPIRVKRFDDYVPKLEAAKVVLDPERRKAIIETEAKNLAFAHGLEIVADEGLLEETAGLVEWPVVLMGKFDEAYLKIPPEVIRLTIRQNQKCFVLRQAVVPPTSLETGEGDHAEHGGGGGSDSAPHSPPPPRSAVPHPRSAGEEPGAAPLTNRFLLVANVEAKDGGKEIVAGNERVIAARLSDARFFWEQDLKVRLAEHAKKLEAITFHEKLGTQAERVERIARLARELAPIVRANPDDAERAARLCKADLTTGMVGEFPELQGVMGRYYFLAENGLSPLTASSPSSLSSRFGREAETGTHTPGAQSAGSSAYGSRTGADAPSGMTTREGSGAESSLRSIADAIRDHYKPQGPNDSMPSDPVSVAVALADKLDTLVGFWAIDEKATGSKDPYALRRAALGVIRLVLASRLRLSVKATLWAAFALHADQMKERGLPFVVIVNEAGAFVLQARSKPDWNVSDVPEWRIDELKTSHSIYKASASNRNLTLVLDRDPRGVFNDPELYPFLSVESQLLAFFADRLKVYLREEGARHDLIDAVFALPGQDDLLMIVRRVDALGKFLDSEDGANLLVGYRRAANILRAEEKKDGEGAFDGAPDHHLIEEKGQPEEKALFHVMQAAERHAREHVEREDFEGAMRALAELRPAVDAFFDKVTVNADDPALRMNRLKLLNMLRRATLAVADFSKIGG